MRVWILALASACLAGSASAQGSTTVLGPDLLGVGPTRPVGSGARRQAEEAIKQGLADPASAIFRAVRVNVVASVRHDAFAEPIDGPVSLVCGQYSWRDDKGVDSGFSWFLVAIKRGHVLWTTSDEAAGGKDAAYEICRLAGLAS